MADNFAMPDWMVQHIELYKTDPAKAHMWTSPYGGDPIPTLLLTTTGRKSGNSLALPLIYKQVGNGFVIIASKGGAPAHPAWFLNLQADPECQFQVGETIYKGTARVATGDERSDLWAQMAALFPPYEDYRKATSREIPVVVLEA